MVESLYSKLTNPQQVQNTHFVDRFYGDIVDERWLISILRGTGTVFMTDDIDEGLNIRVSGAGAPQFKTKISFGGNRQYNEDGAVMIGIWRQLETTSNPGKMALANVSSDALNANFIQTQASTAFNVVTNDGTTTSSTGGSAYDRLEFQHYRIEITPTTALMHGNGILEATHVSNLPTLRLEPTIQQNSQVSGLVRNLRVRYAEAFNT